MWLDTNLLIPSRRVPSSTVNIRRNLPARGARYSLPVSMMTPARVRRLESLFSASHSSPLTSSRFKCRDKLSHTKRPALLLLVSETRSGYWEALTPFRDSQYWLPLRAYQSRHGLSVAWFASSPGTGLQMSHLRGAWLPSPWTFATATRTGWKINISGLIQCTFVTHQMARTALENSLFCVMTHPSRRPAAA